MSAELSSHFLELPRSWLALLFNHVASGPGCLANAATLSLTCKLLHSLYEGPAVTYSNLVWAATIYRPDHPIWQWLHKRIGRIVGLILDVCVEVGSWIEDDLDVGWIRSLQALTGIPGLQLTVEWYVTGNRDPASGHFQVAQWMKQHGQIISHLKAEVYVDTEEGGGYRGEDGLLLRTFSESAAQCRSIDLSVNLRHGARIDLADLKPVPSSLYRLFCVPAMIGYDCGILGVASALAGPWGTLAKMTGLQELVIDAFASGDPSPLSALTRLTALHLKSNVRVGLEVDDLAPFSFSSLQPLSTLRQLKVLHLHSHACGSTSLQGLAGLSSLKQLGLDFAKPGGRLRSLEGLSSGVASVCIIGAPDLLNLAGVEGCASLERLTLERCGVSSLEPLKALSRLEVSITDIPGL
jgi:hypothetical protein